MFFLKNMKVRWKLISAFIAVALLIVVVGIVGSTSLRKVNTSSQNMYNNNLQNVYVLTDMKQNLTDIKSDMLQLVYERDASKRDSLQKNIEDSKAENDKYVAAYEKVFKSESEKQTWTTFKSDLQQYRTLRESIINLVDAGSYDEAVKQYQQIPAVRDAMFTSLSNLINASMDNAKATNADNYTTF